jgi:hypothetical protein
LIVAVWGFVASHWPQDLPKRDSPVTAGLAADQGEAPGNVESADKPARSDRSHDRHDKPGPAADESPADTDTDQFEPLPAQTDAPVSTDDGIAATTDPPAAPRLSDGPAGDNARTQPPPDVARAPSQLPFDEEPFGLDEPSEFPPETVMIPSDELPEDPTGGRPAPSRVDVEARLSDEIPLIEFRSLPLDELLDFLSQLSTIPITLDPEAVLRAGLEPDHPIAVREQDTSVGSVLGNVLESCGLAFRVTPGQLRVVKAGSEKGRLRRVRLDVSDLGGDDPQRIAALADLIRNMIGGGDWQETEDGIAVTRTEDAVILTHNEKSVFRAVELCEKLRVVRGLPTRSRYPARLFETQTRYSQAAAILAKPIRMNFSRPTPLDEILSRLESATGATILVDWEDLAAAHWAPPAATTMLADEVPLEESLDRLLRPMDLAYRVVDADTLQVTTPHALYAHAELEVYPVEDLVGERADGQALVERIQRALGTGLFRGSNAIGAIQIDEPSGCLIARLPQPHQQRMKKILQTWRTGG